MKSVCMMTSVHAHNDVRIYHKEAKALQDSGYRVTIINPVFQGLDKRGILFLRADISDNRMLRMSTACAVLGRIAREVDADIYHIHDPELLPLLLKLKRRGKTVVYDVHEDLPRQILSKTWLPRPSRRRVSEVAERYEQEAAREMDLIVAATETIADRFPGAIVFHNFPDPAEFSRQSPGYIDRKRTAVYAGAISEARGIKQMVNAMGFVDGKLYLAGRFESESLQEQMERLWGYSRVDYQGSLGRGALIDLLHKSRVGLCLLSPTPAYKQSMPIKLFEYLMAGLPVIASDFPYWRELLGEECCLFVESGDVAQLATNLNYLLGNPQVAQRMGEAGRQLVLDKYSLSGERQKLLGAYAQL